jgi:hypothetical protein
MRSVLAIAVIVTMGAMTAAYAEETAMFPDATGKLVRVKVAHTFEECVSNAPKLGYTEVQARGWCAAHCNGTICK